MGPVATYSKGSLALTIVGVSRYTKASLLVGTAPPEPINPKQVDHILRGQ